MRSAMPAAPSASRSATTFSPVPTGTVLFMTSSRSPPRAAISRVARCTRERSASPDGDGGVSTAMKRMRQRVEQLVVGGREGEPRRVVVDELVEAGLVDRHLARLEALDLRRVDVHAHDVMAEVREADRRDEPDVAGADDADRGGRIHGGGHLRVAVRERERPAEVYHRGPARPARRREPRARARDRVTARSPARARNDWRCRGGSAPERAATRRRRPSCGRTPAAAARPGGRTPRSCRAAAAPPC